MYRLGYFEVYPLGGKSRLGYFEVYPLGGRSRLGYFEVYPLGGRSQLSYFEVYPHTFDIKIVRCLLLPDNSDILSFSFISPEPVGGDLGLVFLTLAVLSTAVFRFRVTKVVQAECRRTCSYAEAQPTFAFPSAKVIHYFLFSKHFHNFFSTFFKKL